MKHFGILAAFIFAGAAVSRAETNYCLQLPGGNSAMVTTTNSYAGRLRDFTVSARIRPAQNSASSDQVAMERGLRFGSQTLLKFALGLDSANRPFFRFDSLGGTRYTVRADAPISTDKWHHVAATYDHAYGRATLFVDRRIAKSLFVSEESAAEVFWGSTTLGAHNSTPTATEPTLANFFPGFMDEVQVWDGAFTSWQVASNSYVKPSGTESDLVAFWNFDDQTARDATTNGWHGALVGDAQIVPRDIVCTPPIALSCQDQIVFSFQTLPDAVYAVEFCTNLDHGIWTGLGDEITGNGGVMGVEEPPDNSIPRFYRAREIDGTPE